MIQTNNFTYKLMRYKPIHVVHANTFKKTNIQKSLQVFKTRKQII